jgi:hypothetical protein
MPQQGSLLIIEGNADVMRRQGHTRIVNTIEKLVLPYVDAEHLRYHRLRINCKADLELSVEWARLFNVQFDAVLLLAHGSLEGADVAPGLAMSWTEIAALLAPLEPRTVLAVSCHAAASGPADALFSGIPTLVAYGGAATTLTATQAGVAALQLVLAAFGALPEASLSALATMLNAADTGGLVFWRQRDTFEAASDGDRLIGDLLAIIGAEAIHELWAPRRRRLAPPRRRLAPPRRRLAPPARQTSAPTLRLRRAARRPRR